MRAALKYVAKLTLGLLPPRWGSAILFRYRLGRWPSRASSSFSDKIHFYKMDRRYERMPQLADKVAVKEFVAGRLGREWVIPNLFVGKALPPRADRKWVPPYVIKTNNNSGTNIFIRQISDVNWDKIEKRLYRFLQDRHPKISNEWPYYYIEPMILVEKMLGEEPPVDYKIFVFYGKAKLIQVDTDRFTEHKRAFFDIDWSRLPFSLEFPLETRPIERPVTLDRMIDAAEKLAEGLPFVRVDFYEVDGRPYFGEMTFFPGSGTERFHPLEWDHRIGMMFVK